MKSKESNKSPEKTSAILLIRKPMQLISNSQAAPVPSQVTQTADSISTTGIWGAHAAAAAADRIVFLVFRFCFVCVCDFIYLSLFSSILFFYPSVFFLFHVRLFFPFSFWSFVLLLHNYFVSKSKTLLLGIWEDFLTAAFNFDSLQISTDISFITYLLWGVRWRYWAANTKPDRTDTNLFSLS